MTSDTSAVAKVPIRLFDSTAAPTSLAEALHALGRRGDFLLLFRLCDPQPPAQHFPHPALTQIEADRISVGMPQAWSNHGRVGVKGECLWGLLMQTPINAYAN